VIEGPIVDQREDIAGYERRQTMRGAVRALIALGSATAVWLGLLHLLFMADLDDFFGGDSGLRPGAASLAARHVKMWSEPTLKELELKKMRQSNAEWDFMGRTFLVLALANMSLRDPGSADKYVDVIDRIIDETIKIEAEHGVYYFLMPYARERPFMAKSGRSIFVDGEIALMLAARRIVRESDEYATLLEQRLDSMVHQMKDSPVMCSESYPDECWMFCNAVGMAALRMSDVLDGTDHSEFISDWLASIKRNLVDSDTGMLISSFSVDGQAFDGPEGSSIWMVAHCLDLVDPEFARDQYCRARQELGRSVLGFGYAREWPRSWQSPADVDSGPIIPVLEMSAGSSGMAVLGAASFEDREFLLGLMTSLKFAGFPVRRDGELKFCASNQVGDAVLLYAMVQGPVWASVKRRWNEAHVSSVGWVDKSVPVAAAGEL
jgi:hypothetical protein